MPREDEIEYRAAAEAKDRVARACAKSCWPRVLLIVCACGCPDLVVKQKVNVARGVELCCELMIMIETTPQACHYYSRLTSSCLSSPSSWQQRRKCDGITNPNPDVRTTFIAVLHTHPVLSVLPPGVY